ncbi:hypothetical protein PRIPAC_90934, partial [Pristionchus pacificus]
GVFTFIIILFSQSVHTYTGESTMNDLRVACFASLMKRPMAYFDREETSPAACSILLAQQPPVAMAIVHNSMSNMIENVVGGLVIAVFAFLICWPNGFVGLAYLLIFFTTFALVEHYSNESYNELVEVDKSGELAMEIFDNSATIQQLSVESHFQERYDEFQRKRTKPLTTKIRCLSFVHALNESEYMLLSCIATSTGIYFVFEGFIDIKQLYGTEFCILILGYCALMMSESFKDIVLASSAARLIFKLIDPSKNENKDETGNEEPLNGFLRADSVSFAYPSRPHRRIINDINIAVREGHSLALVGPSGEGKSTIVNLIERFYHPTQGQLYLDNIPFPSISSASLRSSIALVSQEPVLFRGTIIDNVRLGVDNASDEEVIEACRMANAHEFIQHSPEGYLTPVGEKGRSLSGGQKQRIAIARALVRNPRVIVLDEATSALDTQSEQVVREALLSST